MIGVIVLIKKAHRKGFESIYPDFFDAGHAGKYYDREKLIQIKNRIKKNNNKEGDKC